MLFELWERSCWNGPYNESGTVCSSEATWPDFTSQELDEQPSDWLRFGCHFSVGCLQKVEWRDLSNSNCTPFTTLKVRIYYCHNLCSCDFFFFFMIIHWLKNIYLSSCFLIFGMSGTERDFLPVKQTDVSSELVECEMQCSLSTKVRAFEGSKHRALSLRSQLISPCVMLSLWL